MPICKLCKEKFATKQIIDGKVRNLQNRKYCLTCSPFGSGNTRKLEIPPLSEEEERKKNNAKYKKWQRKARKERKEKLVSLLGGKCNICGYNKCLSALEFHHSNGEEKSFTIASIGLLTSWDKLVEETQKCKLLCCRCHREVHEGMHQNFRWMA